MEICEICRKRRASIHLTGLDGKTRIICRDCCNELAAKEMGIELAPFESRIYEYPGRYGKVHRFNIEKIVSPMGLGYEAVEIKKDSSSGYKVAIMDGPDCDQDYLFYQLEAKIRSTLSKRYLKSGTYPNGVRYTGLREDEAVGRLEYSETDDIPGVVIDGRVFSWEELGKMLNAFKGFQFKLKIYDITDDPR